MNLLAEYLLLESLVDYTTITLKELKTHLYYFISHTKLNSLFT